MGAMMQKARFLYDVAVLAPVEGCKTKSAKIKKKNR